MNLPRAALVLAAATALVAMSCSARSGSDTTPSPEASAPAKSATPMPTTVVQTSEPKTPAVPTARPTAATTPLPTLAPAPGGQLIEHGDRNSRLIALTFDMGGRVEPALDIMNWLLANDVRATIFMTGAIVENQNTDAGRQVLGIVEEHPERFELGNHSYSHPDFRTLTAAEMTSELDRTQAAIAAHSALDSRPLFRPPLGGVDDEVVSVVAKAGYDRVIMWDIDTIDWRPEADGGPTAADVASKVTTRAQGGSIVLMHLGGYNTLDALPGMVAGLRGAGFELARVSEMLE